MNILILLLGCTYTDKATESDTSDNYTTEDSTTDTSSSIVVFPAADVDQSTIDNTVQWLETAQDLWFSEDTFGWENDLYSPIYLVIVGNDMEATVDLEQQYCDHLRENHSESFEFSRCKNVSPFCENGICLFTEYVTYGGAGIASSRQNDGYHLMIMAAKNPYPEEEDYKKVVLHEGFHIYQLSQHNELDYEIAEEIMGRRSGDHNENVPWWSEGTAEYMAVYEYSQQEGVDEDYFEREMRNKIGYFEGNDQAYVINEYFDFNTKLYNITFDENGHLGYHIGSWFVAYLVNTHGQQKIFDFYQNAHLMSFDENFTTQFGQDHRTTVDDFEVFLQQDDKEQILEILR